MTRAALVTGAAGFIGSALVRSLAASGVRVHAIDRAPPHEALRAQVADWTIADLADGLPSGLRLPDEVFHCAGAATVGASFEDPAADRRANVTTTESLLASLEGRQVRVVLVSSAAVYGAQSALPIPETAGLKPVSPYGEHKRLAEDLLRRSGLSASIVRLFSVYGPGLRKQLLWDACTKLSRGSPSFSGSGSEVRDWLHVDDAAALLAKAATAATPSCPVFNGGTGAPVAVRDVLGMLARELGCVVPLEFSGENRRGDPPTLVADTKAARAIGWASKVSLPDGIAEYATWFRSAAR